MTTYKLIALAFIFLTPLFSHILVSVFKLGRYGIKFPDIAFVLFALEILLVSGKFFNHNILPYYLILLALLAIVISLNLIFKSQNFYYRRFLKLFWRIGFLLTFALYIILVLYIFIAL